MTTPCSSCDRCRRSTATAPTEVHALRDVDLTVERRRAGGGHGPERLGQEHPAHHRRQPRGADQRRGAGRRRRRSAGMSRNDRARAAPPLDRLRVPGLQPAGRPHRGRERRRCRWSSTACRPGRRRAAGARRPRRARPRPSAPTASPTSSPAASASGSRSPAPSSASATCCWPTSRPARSTRSTARR